MRLVYKCSALAVTVCIAIGCNTKRFDSNPALLHVTDNGSQLDLLKVDEVQIDTKSDEVEVARLKWRIETNESGSKYVFHDLVLAKFIVINSDGEILSQFGGKGRGPTEFLQVLSYTVDENERVIAFDESQKLIKIFTIDGALVNTFQVLSNENLSETGLFLEARDGVIYMGILENRYLASGEQWKSNLIAKYDYQGNFLGFIGRYDKGIKDSNFYGHGVVFGINFDTGKLYSTHMDMNSIQVYDIKSGERENYFIYDETHFQSSKREIRVNMNPGVRNELLATQSITRGLISTDTHLLHTYQNSSVDWYTTRDPDELTNYLTIYDGSRNNFLDEIEIPGNLAGSFNNQLFVIEDTNPDNFTFGVYELSTQQFSQGF